MLRVEAVPFGGHLVGAHIDHLLKRRWAELAHSPSRQLIELVDHRALLLIIHPAVEDGQQREG